MANVLTKVVFNEYHLASQYDRALDCPIHRATREKIKSDIYFSVGEVTLRFGDNFVKFTDEMIAVGKSIINGQAQPGLTFHVPIPEEYLADSIKD